MKADVGSIETCRVGGERDSAGEHADVSDSLNRADASLVTDVRLPIFLSSLFRLHSRFRQGSHFIVVSLEQEEEEQEDT